MTSQMNMVQNAARLAMDHRAADPRRLRRPIHSGAVWWLAMAVVAAVGLVAVLVMPF